MKTKAYKDVMLDIETLPTAPDAAILSIGAVTFVVQKVLDALYYS